MRGLSATSAIGIHILLPNRNSFQRVFCLVRSSCPSAPVFQLYFQKNRSDMFRMGSFKGTMAGVKKYFFSSCDAVEEDDDISDTPSLIEQADAAVENDKKRIKTPMQYENLRNSLSAASVNTYDGMRFIVQKQVNLNTVVSHFYWVGSQANGGNPLYQYRIILPVDDDKVINVATDLDFNLEGEVKCGLTPNIVAKSNFVNGEQNKSLSLELELTDESSATQFKYTKSGADEYSMSFMQCILPALSLGGSGTYSTKSQALTSSVGFIYDPAEYMLAAQYDKELKVAYLRRVNPNRVHLATDLTVDEQGGTVMSVNAEFMLKQSRLVMGVDSNLLLKSYLETSLNPGTQLQLCAEMMQAANHYKFGFGIVMG